MPIKCQPAILSPTMCRLPFVFAWLSFAFLNLIIFSIALLYSVVPNIASNFSFSFLGSSSGQLDSSWWQNSTLPIIAFDTPIQRGISVLTSMHRLLIDWLRPSTTMSTVESSVSNFNTALRLVVFIDRVTQILSPRNVRICNFTCPIHSECPKIFGSCTKLWPRFVPPGGRSPVNAYLRHSMTVVLPHPLAPRISVNGGLKAIDFGVKWIIELCDCYKSNKEKWNLPEHLLLQRQNSVHHELKVFRWWTLCMYLYTHCVFNIK